MDLTPPLVAKLAALGLAAGLLGGLAGLGGSMFMIPGLAWIIGYSRAGQADQHLYMGAALVVNVLVAIPATWRHARNGFFKRELFAKVLPGQLVGVAAGSALSNAFEGSTLKVVLGALIMVVVLLTLARDALAKGAPESPRERSALALSSLSGVTGLLSGLAGLGGGALVVPALQFVGRVPLRHAIAVSSAMLCVSSSAGAAIKLGTLPRHGFGATEALALSAAMGPTAVVGSMLGAEIAKRLSVSALKWAVSALLVFAAYRMIAAG